MLPASTTALPASVARPPEHRTASGRFFAPGRGNRQQNQRFSRRSRRGAESLDYMHARFFNPQVGRFLSVDPGPSVDMGHPQGWNLYAYVEGNPLRYVDPNGEGLWDAVAGFGNAFASNLSLGLYRRAESGNPDFQAGQRLGDQAALVAGLAEGQQGAAAVVGAAACEAGTLGGCTPAAVPAAAAGVVAIVHGSAVSAIAGQNLAASMNSGGGGGGATEASGQRFFKKAPKGSENFQTVRNADGSTMFRFETPGKVPGSKAVYEKTVNAAGETVLVVKKTFDPQGNLVHTKVKMKV